MEEWFTTHESAAYLGYSYFHFMREIKTDPRFPKPFRRPTASGYGHSKYRRKDLDRWVDNNVVKAA